MARRTDAKRTKAPRGARAAARRRTRRTPIATAATVTPATAAVAPHVAKAEAYVAGVLEGSIPACKWVRKACQRHRRDAARAKGNWRYRFDAAKAERACKIIELMPHIKGEKARTLELIILEGWQCFFVVSIFGWVDRVTGARRFRIVYLEVPRKNGKSTLLAAILAVMAFLDGEPGAEGYSAATTRDQARIVFAEYLQPMIRRSPELRTRYGVEVLAKSIVQEASSSKVEALSADAHTLEGLNTHIGVIDELHAHKTRKVYDVLESSMGARRQPLLVSITTAGDDLTGICYEVRTYLTKVLEQIVEDDTFFGMVYTVDAGDDWTTEESWRKANPNYGVSVYPEYLANLARKAMQTPAAQNNFKTKHLNIWVSSNSALYSIDAWNACRVEDLTASDVAHLPCIIGMDLASTTDLCARADVYCDDSGDEPVFTVLCRNYVPEDTIAAAANAQYSGWEIDGRLIATPGDSTDYMLIEEELDELSPPNLRETVFDKYQSRSMASSLLAQGRVAVELSMNVATLSEPTKLLDVLMRKKRIRHDGDPVLAWAISNVVGHYDAKDNVYPRKERPENKIDPAIALLMALARWTSGEVQEAGSIYDTEDIIG